MDGQAPTICIVVSRRCAPPQRRSLTQQPEALALNHLMRRAGPTPDTVGTDTGDTCHVGTRCGRKQVDESESGGECVRTR